MKSFSITMLSRVLMPLVVAFSLSAFAQAERKTLPLAEARARISEAVLDAKVMASLMKRLSAEDQVSFLAEVNESIAGMPGSGEERAAAFLSVNSAALRNAAKGNTANLLAEVYASVSPEALPLITERFSADLFNRSADPSRSYSDAAFTSIARSMMDKIVKRNTGSDDSAVRNAFAAMLFMRASNGTPKDLDNILIDRIPDASARELAKTEWLPAAMAEKPNYESMLAHANAEEAPDGFVAIKISGVQALDAMLSDLAEDVLDPSGRTATPLLDRAFGHFGEARVMDYPDPVKLKEFGDEPKPYQWQQN